MCSWAHPSHRCGCFPFDEGKANLLAGPGNIGAAVPTSGLVIKSHRASLRDPGDEGTGWRMPSHPSPPPAQPPTLLPLPPSSTGAQPESGTGGWVEQKYQHLHKCMDKHAFACMGAKDQDIHVVLKYTQSHEHELKQTCTHPKKEFVCLSVSFCKPKSWNHHHHRRTHTSIQTTLD